jgi:hypothetical protein
MFSTRGSVLLWPTLSALGLAFAAIPAGATMRTAPYIWAPASGPVGGYYLYLSVDGQAEQNYGAVFQPSAVIQLDSGAEVIVRVAAFDVAGRVGPRSDASPPLRLCPGDFDGNETIETADVNKAKSCLFKPATGNCSGADMDDNGAVALPDVLAMEVGSDACAPLDGCLGDMDGNDFINGADLYAMKSCIGLYAQGNCADADYDGNGFVTNIDVVNAYKSGVETCN